MYATPGAPIAVNEIVCPWHTGLLLDATGGDGATPMARLALAVALPQALTAVTDSVGEPADAKQTGPGAMVFAVAGVPPGKVQFTVAGAPQSMSAAMGATHCPAQMPASGETCTWGAAFTVIVCDTAGTLQLFRSRN
jgi:hypothetical protein